MLNARGEARRGEAERLTEEEGDTMPGWQSELEALLSQLHVSLEPGRLPSPGARAPASASGERDATAPEDGAVGMDGLDGTDGADGADVSLPWDLDTLAPDDLPPDGDEVNAVSREIEATVRRVISMARAGQMEGALRDDVVFVLQALTRPSPYERPGRRRKGKADEEGQEWQLASAAAVLRFCRIVLRLTDALERETDP